MKKHILGGIQDIFLDQHDGGIGTNHSNNIVEHGPKRKKMQLLQKMFFNKSNKKVKVKIKIKVIPHQFGLCLRDGQSGDLVVHLSLNSLQINKAQSSQGFGYNIQASSNITCHEIII